MRRLKGHKWQNKANLLLAYYKAVMCKGRVKGVEDMQDQSKRRLIFSSRPSRKDDYLI